MTGFKFARLAATLCGGEMKLLMFIAINEIEYPNKNRHGYPWRFLNSNINYSEQGISRDCISYHYYGPKGP